MQCKLVSGYFCKNNVIVLDYTELELIMLVKSRRSCLKVKTFLEKDVYFQHLILLYNSNPNLHYLKQYSETGFSSIPEVEVVFSNSSSGF